MFVRIAKSTMNMLASYLNKKYMERVVKHGRGYSVRKFAEEVGIQEGTMLRLLNEKTNVKGIELDNLKKLALAFGVEFLREIGLIQDAE